MGKKKKAQGSLEFLMTYGWVIFVVLGVLAAFTFIGVLKPETFVTERCFMAPPLFCEDVHFDALTGDVSLRIHNSFIEDINVNELQLSGREECYILLPNPNDKIIESDSYKEFVIDCDFTPGQNIRSTVELKYSEAGSPEGLEKVSRGEAVGSLAV